MNNRQFKFRAWNGIEFLDSEYWKITNSGIENYCDENQELIIQQWTGLHDKNGNEIYEGDIIKFENEPDEVLYREVIFNHGYFAYDRIQKGFHGALLYGINVTCEVTGNIFETPSLLK